MFHISPKLIKVIMSYVSSANNSILFNGGTLEAFAISRGIRQGDSLSPYLFIPRMEYLGYLIYKECAEGNWTPMKASRLNVGVSHLFFANDLILFSRRMKRAMKPAKR